MKKFFYLLLTLSLCAVSCSKSDVAEDDTIFKGSNDNQRIAGGWRLIEFSLKEVEADNTQAVAKIMEQYKMQLGEEVHFSKEGTYTTSGSFHEVASRYKLKDGLLIFAKDNAVKVSFEGDTYSYESDATEAFKWFMKQAFMADFKDAKVTKAIVVRKYKQLKINK